MALSGLNQTYKNIRPIWDDNPHQFGETTLLLAHARSAFRDEGIVIENNMPFSDGRLQFIFNGELHSVRIKAEGRIGAEKIFNFIRRFDNGNLSAAIEKATAIITKRSKYVRAMNLILSDGRHIHFHTQFNEDPDYFTVHIKKQDGLAALCSRPFAGESDWRPVENNCSGELTWY